MAGKSVMAIIAHLLAMNRSILGSKGCIIYDVLCKYDTDLYLGCLKSAYDIRLPSEYLEP